MMGRRPIWFSLLSVGCLVQAAPSDPLQARAAAVKSVPGYLYQGCYEEPSTGRALPSKTAQDGMTVELCASIAAGKAWFGLEYGRECWYGDALASGTYSSTAESDCSKPCSGDASELCGASMRLNLYKKEVTITTSVSQGTTSSSSTSSAPSQASSDTASYVSLGCIQDNASANGRTLPDKKYTNAAMTVELCAQTAKTYRYKYFGLEYATECWMANTVNPLAQWSVKGDNPTCTTSCPGNTSQLCGGRARMNLYSFASASSPASTIGTTTSSATVTPVTTSSTAVAPGGLPSSTATVDLTKTTLSENAQLTTDAQGKSVVNLAPIAQGQASIEVPPSVLPAVAPGANVAVQVSYETVGGLTKRADVAQCSLVIMLGGVIIYNDVITTSDGNYTTVTVLTNYPTGPTTLIVTEYCPGDSATPINVGGISVGPAPSSTTSSLPLSTSVPLTTPSSTFQTVTQTTAEQSASSLPPSTNPAQVPSSTASQVATTTGIPNYPGVTTLSAPAYTSSTCRIPTGAYYTNGCILSGAPQVPESGLVAVATGIPNPGAGSSDPELETCAGLCASNPYCSSWNLDRGNWPVDTTSDWSCWLYTGPAKAYAYNYNPAYRQIVWYSSGCYNCSALDPQPLPSTSTSSISATVIATTTGDLGTVSPPATVTQTPVTTTEDSGTLSPPFTISQTPTSTGAPSATTAIVTAAPASIPTRSAAAYPLGTCTDANLNQYIACDISGVNTPTAATQSGPLLAVVTDLPQPLQSAGHDWEAQYEACALECASTEGCLSYVVDTGARPYISHPWTCLLYAIDADAYIDSEDNESEFDQYIWFNNRCYNCVLDPASPTPSPPPVDQTSTPIYESTSTGSWTTATTTPTSTSVTPSSTQPPATITPSPVVSTLAAPALGARSCHYPDGQWYTNACTISGYPTPTSGLIAVATGVVPPSSGNYDFNPEYQACAALCSDIEECGSYVMDRGQWPTDQSDWKCYLFSDSIDPRAWLQSSQSSQAYGPLVWMDKDCYVCDPATVTTSVPSSSTSDTSSAPITSLAPSTTAVPTITAPPAEVPTVTAVYDPSACSTVPFGPCSISGFPTATTGLLAVITGVPVYYDTDYYNVKDEAVSCELACIDTAGCTSFVLDRTEQADTNDWNCYLYGVDADDYLRSADSAQQFNPLLWYDRNCFECGSPTPTPSMATPTPSSLISPTTASSTSVPTSTTPSTVSAPITTASAVATIAAPTYGYPYTCGYMPQNTGPCSISGFPAAPTGLVAVATGVHVYPDSNYFNLDKKPIECEIACINTPGCTSFVLDRTDRADTVDWQCLLYGIDANSYVLSADMNGQYDPLLWYDKSCFECFSIGPTGPIPLTSAPVTTSVPTTSTSTTTTPNPTSTCTRVADPDPSLTCNIRGFAAPPAYSFAVNAPSEDVCAAYCVHQYAPCVSYMWNPTTQWCGGYAVDTWSAIGDGAAGAGVQYKSNVFDDVGCWECTGGQWNA